MSETKEFQGKNLDEAIEAACAYYDLKRDKLEIEIVSGGSSGIFGLVGVKKAAVRAKPRGSFKSLGAEAEDQAPKAERAPRSERAERAPRSERAERAPKPERSERPARRESESAPTQEAALDEAFADVQPGAQPEAQPVAQPVGDGEQPRRSERGRRGRGRGRGERQPERDGNRPPEAQSEPNGNRIPEVRPERPDRDGNRDPNRPAEARNDRGRGRGRGERGGDRPRREAPSGAPVDDEEGGAPQGIGHLDQALLEQTAREVTQKLLAPLVENAQVAVTLQPDRVCVRIEDPDNTGLLIGREGQTLASIQYLVNRLVSKRMDASVRVQIDAGDYRENQDERLRQIARHLADKVQSSGRTQSTRPMSSYHRRVVHLTLQDDEFVFTRSKGEGSMKRVLIMSKRKGKNGESLEDAAPEADSGQDYSESAGE